MAYTRVTRTHNGRGAIEYAMGKGQGHNDNECRNEYISTVNLLPGVDPIVQMQKYWMTAGKNHTTQVLRIVQSFSKKEFDPESPNDILAVNILGSKFASEHYPGRQCMIFTQTDGKSGLVHNHIIINDVHMETNKGCRNQQYYWPTLKKWTDDIASKYTELDYGDKAIDKISQTERTKREQGKYVWKDDLKERVKKSMDEAISIENFFERLKQNGIGVKTGKSKNYGLYFTYELQDLSAVPEGTRLPKRALKSRSYKLGEDFCPAALTKKLRIKRKKKEVVSMKQETEKVVEKDLASEKVFDEIRRKAKEKLRKRKADEEKRVEEELAKVKAKRAKEEKAKKERAAKAKVKAEAEVEAAKRHEAQNEAFRELKEVDYSKSITEDKEIARKKEDIETARVVAQKEQERDMLIKQKWKARSEKLEALMAMIEQKQDDGMEFE